MLTPKFQAQISVVAFILPKISANNRWVWHRQDTTATCSWWVVVAQQLTPAPTWPSSSGRLRHFSCRCPRPCHGWVCCLLTTSALSVSSRGRDLACRATPSTPAPQGLFPPLLASVASAAHAIHKKKGQIINIVNGHHAGPMEMSVLGKTWLSQTMAQSPTGTAPDSSEPWMSMLTATQPR